MLIIIDNLELSLNALPTELANELESYTKYGRDLLSSVLAELFDRYSPPEGVREIESIDIDLGIIDKNFISRDKLNEIVSKQLLLAGWQELGDKKETCAPKEICKLNPEERSCQSEVLNNALSNEKSILIQNRCAKKLLDAEFRSRLSEFDGRCESIDLDCLNNLLERDDCFAKIISYKKALDGIDFKSFCDINISDSKPSRNQENSLDNLIGNIEVIKDYRAYEFSDSLKRNNYSKIVNANFCNDEKISVGSFDIENSVATTIDDDVKILSSNVDSIDRDTIFSNSKDLLSFFGLEDSVKLAWSYEASVVNLEYLDVNLLFAEYQWPLQENLDTHKKQQSKKFSYFETRFSKQDLKGFVADLCLSENVDTNCSHLILNFDHLRGPLPDGNEASDNLEKNILFDNKYVYTAITDRHVNTEGLNYWVFDGWSRPVNYIYSIYKITNYDDEQNLSRKSIRGYLNTLFLPNRCLDNEMYVIGNYSLYFDLTRAADEIQYKLCLEYSVEKINLVVAFNKCCNILEKNLGDAVAFSECSNEFRQQFMYKPKSNTESLLEVDPSIDEIFFKGIEKGKDKRLKNYYNQPESSNDTLSAEIASEDVGVEVHQEINADLEISKLIDKYSVETSSYYIWLLSDQMNLEYFKILLCKYSLGQVVKLPLHVHVAIRGHVAENNLIVGESVRYLIELFGTVLKLLESEGERITETELCEAISVLSKGEFSGIEPNDIVSSISGKASLRSKQILDLEFLDELLSLCRRSGKLNKTDEMSIPDDQVDSVLIASILKEFFAFKSDASIKQHKEINDRLSSILLIFYTNYIESGACKPLVGDSALCQIMMRANRSLISDITSLFKNTERDKSSNYKTDKSNKKGPIEKSASDIKNNLIQKDGREHAENDSDEVKEFEIENHLENKLDVFTCWVQRSYQNIYKSIKLEQDNALISDYDQSVWSGFPDTPKKNQIISFVKVLSIVKQERDIPLLEFRLYLEVFVIYGLEVYLSLLAKGFNNCFQKSLKEKIRNEYSFRNSDILNRSLSCDLRKTYKDQRANNFRLVVNCDGIDFEKNQKNEKIPNVQKNITSPDDSSNNKISSSEPNKEESAVGSISSGKLGFKEFNIKNDQRTAFNVEQDVSYSLYLNLTEFKQFEIEPSDKNVCAGTLGSKVPGSKKNNLSYDVDSCLENTGETEDICFLENSRVEEECKTGKDIKIKKRQSYSFDLFGQEKSIANSQFSLDAISQLELASEPIVSDSVHWNSGSVETQPNPVIRIEPEQYINDNSFCKPKQFIRSNTEALSQAYDAVSNSLITLPSGMFGRDSNFETEANKLPSKSLINHCLTKDINLGEILDITNKISLRRPENAYMVQDAGIVILAPFLTKLWSRCDFDKYDIETARHLMLELLYWTVWQGEQEELEGSSIATSLAICGYEESEFEIDELKKPNQNHLKELNDLIDSLQLYWTVLEKYSCSNGLRSMFFQREGKLRKKSESWQLEVKKTGHDILLGSCPWSFKMLRFPWSKSTVIVDWSFASESVKRVF